MWKLYSLNLQGNKLAEEIMSGIPESSIAMIRNEIVGWVLEKDFRDLVKEIYQEYPDFALNSVFRG